MINRRARQFAIPDSPLLVHWFDWRLVRQAVPGPYCEATCP
jgi:hypothetical protein